MIIPFTLTAVFIAWIWVDYYRLIDIYEKESLKYFIITFLLGCLSVLFVLGVDSYLIKDYLFTLNGNFLNDFLYCVINIGMIEELAKLIPFLIVYKLFRNQINEPIDYLVFISISALGFSAVENILYFYKYGPEIINSRAILCSVSHMFSSSLVAYGIIKYKYHPNKKNILSIPIFFALASISHGFYDFWLISEGTTGWWMVTIFYFMITISIFASILNNSLNNSSFFTYKKVINSTKVSLRLISYYGLVFLIQFAFLVYKENFMYAFSDLTASIFTTGFVIIITCERLSRFKLIQHRWNKVNIELPFSFGAGDPFGMTSSVFRIQIKGDPYSESQISEYYEEFFHLTPLTKRKTYIGNTRIAYIEKKLFLKNDESFYLTKLFYSNDDDKHELLLIKPKRKGETMVNDKYPIVAVLKIDHLDDYTDVNLTIKDFKFQEWAFIKEKSI